MADVEANAGGHVKKSSANEAAKGRVIAAPPLSSSSSTKKTPVLLKPDADGEELLHGNRIRRAVNESLLADEGKENDKGVAEQRGSPAVGSEGGNSIEEWKVTEVGVNQNKSTLEEKKPAQQSAVQDAEVNSKKSTTMSPAVSVDESHENKKGVGEQWGSPAIGSEVGNTVEKRKVAEVGENQNNGTLEEKKPVQQSAEQAGEGDSKKTTTTSPAVSVDEDKVNDKGVSELSALGSKGGNASVEGRKETDLGDVADTAAEKAQNIASSAENEPGLAPESDEKKSTTAAVNTGDKNVAENLSSNAETADGTSATVDNSTDVNQASFDQTEGAVVESSTPKEASEGNNGVEEKAAEEAGAADESKEKEEVGIVQEAEKPIVTEAPERKEDEITNEGDAQQGWQPPQAPRNPPPPAFIDKMGAGLEAQANYFSYFVVIAILCIVFYLVFHNKQKILALILEGRRQRSTGRRRSSGAQYRKLDNHLEEAGGIDGNGADNAASEVSTKTTKSTEK